MKLVDLHRNYIRESARSVIDNSLPVRPVQQVDAPILAIEKWKSDEAGRLTKRYIFDSVEMRNRFINTLLNYELEKGHHATFKIAAKEVVVYLITHDVEKITELDKNYAKYADVVKRDLAYSKINLHV